MVAAVSATQKYMKWVLNCGILGANIWGHTVPDEKLNTSKKMTTKGGGRTTIQCRSDGLVEVIVLISRQHGYDSQQAYASSLSLPIMSAFLWNPQDMTRSSLM